MISFITKFYYTKIHCLFFLHRGSFIFDHHQRKYIVKCKYCGNKGEGYIDDN
jgi:hypothetical protein